MGIVLELREVLDTRGELHRRGLAIARRIFTWGRRDSSRAQKRPGVLPAVTGVPTGGRRPAAGQRRARAGWSGTPLSGGWSGGSRIRFSLWIRCLQAGAGLTPVLPLVSPAGPMETFGRVALPVE